MGRIVCCLPKRPFRRKCWPGLPLGRCGSRVSLVCESQGALLRGFDRRPQLKVKLPGSYRSGESAFDLGCVKTCTDENPVESFSSPPPNWAHGTSARSQNTQFELTTANNAKNSCRGLLVCSPREGNRILRAFFASVFSRGLDPLQNRSKRWRSYVRQLSAARIHKTPRRSAPASRQPTDRRAGPSSAE